MSVQVELMIIGTAYWSGGSGDLAPVYRKTPAPGERVPPPDSLPFPDFVRYGLSAWASFIVQGEGPVVVQANSIYDSNGRYGGAIPRDQGAYIFFNTGSNCNPASSVTTLKLRPAKAYRHTHDSITLTAVARDINGTPVRGATVVFAVHGDCHPRTTQPNSVVTNGAGEAFFKVVADEPGAVTVVAATLGASGIPVVSEASVIFFFTHHHHHREEREKRFYARCEEVVPGIVVGSSRVVPTINAVKQAHSQVGVLQLAASILLDFQSSGRETPVL